MQIMERYRSMRIHWQAFWLTLLLAAVVFVPFMILDKGYFFFFGDFNVQQVPFYQMAHQAVRSGEIFWNWKTDLGVNFLASYSFYLLFSPFFWLTLPFPNSFVPYLMGPLLILKTACAACTSCLYLQRFVQDKKYSLIGGLLYAFSGFTVYNIFFNHFHEPIIFFPLLLVALENLVEGEKKGWFALAVAANCVVNYWFFIGEVVFVILYVFVRMSTPEWKINFKKFCTIALEAVLGLGLAMVILLPSVMAIMGNPRTTSDNLLSGWNFWIYWNDQRLGAILQSIFFPPELPSRPNFFPDHGAKWSSMSAWLPALSTVGVFSYLLSGKKKDWLKRLLILSFFLALTPGTNSMFILFNEDYYARWFYMPVLLMCAASIIALEQTDIDLKRGLRWTGGILLFFTVMVGFTPIKVDKKWQIGLMNEPARFWLTVAIAVLCWLVVGNIIKCYRHDPNVFYKKMLAAVAVLGVGHNIVFIASGKLCSEIPTAFIRDTAIAGRTQLELPGEDFYGRFARADIYSSMDNTGMYWDLPNIQAFHSIIPNSIMEFYPQVGVKRDVSSKPDVRYFALRPLLSVRWFLVPENKDSEELMPGYTYVSNQLGYNIYKNDNWMPMGFGYDTAYDPILFNSMPMDMRSRVMLQAVYLDEEAIMRNEDLLTLLDEPPYATMDYADMENDVHDRLDMACYSFVIDQRGFTAKSDLEKETLMFFSVPYDEGWSATVNGEEVLIERANLGFMAVRVPQGVATIRFTYLAPGLKLGAVVTLVSATLLAAYWIIGRKKGPVPVAVVEIPEEPVEGTPGDTPAPNPDEKPEEARFSWTDDDPTKEE